jgi:hypothetical protein
MELINNFNSLLENFDKELCESTLNSFTTTFQTSTRIPIEKDLRKRIFIFLKEEFILKEQEPNNSQIYALIAIRILLREPIATKHIVQNEVVDNLIRIISQNTSNQSLYVEAYKCLINVLHHEQEQRTHFADKLTNENFPDFSKNIKNLEMLFYKSRLIFYATYSSDTALQVFNNNKTFLLEMFSVLFLINPSI